jgi:GNAT superfamily N-acetyltransferase
MGFVNGGDRLNYKKATQSDIPHLVTHRKQQLIDEGASPDTNIDKELADYFAASISDGSFIAWLAAEGEQIVATSGICFYRLPPTYYNPTGRVAYVTNMYTAPKYRRQGIASRLLDLVVDEAVMREYKFVRLHASVDGKPLYVKKGFTDTDRFMVLKL